MRRSRGILADESSLKNLPWLCPRSLKRIKVASGLAGWIAPQTLRHDESPRPAPLRLGRGKHRASPPPAEPSPFGYPHPGTPLQLRNSQNGWTLSAQIIYSAVGGRMLLGAVPPRALWVTALANLCQGVAPFCPQRGRPGPKDESRGENRTKDSGIGFTPSLRYGVKPVYRSVTILAKGRKARALAPARPRA
jgi:hypothetical protein